MVEISCAFEVANHLGESPVWSVGEQALWWVNCEQPPELHFWRPEDGTHATWTLPKRIGGFVFKAGGGLLLALADGVYDFTPHNGALHLRAPSPLPPHVKLHECQCDRQGRLWVGAYDHDFPANRSAKGGSWFRLDGDELTPVVKGVSVANGLAFSPDGRTMYASDSPTRRVEAYDLDPQSGSISNCRTFLSLGEDEGFIDGATIDSAGGYWLANVGAGAMRRYLPDGTLDRIIALPFPNPTKAAFGGADMRTLFITSTRLPIPTTTALVPNGAIYAFRPGEVGIAETPCAW